jgi:hypothetical protein
LYLTPKSYVENLKKVFNRAYKFAINKRNKSSIRQKIIYDRRVRACEFKVGDLVLKLKLQTRKGESRKFKLTWEKDVYEVVKRTNKVDYLIQKWGQKKAKKKCVHQSQLKRAFVNRWVVEENKKTANEQERIETFFTTMSKEKKNSQIKSNLNMSDVFDSEVQIELDGMSNESLCQQSQLNKTSQSEVNNEHDQSMAYDLEKN